jgi:hypothetical protein
VHGLQQMRRQQWCDMLCSTAETRTKIFCDAELAEEEQAAVDNTQAETTEHSM